MELCQVFSRLVDWGKIASPKLEVTSMVRRIAAVLVAVLLAFALTAGCKKKSTTSETTKSPTSVMQKQSETK
jgi:uncharacterized lipoprotein YajG